MVFSLSKGVCKSEGHRQVSAMVLVLTSVPIIVWITYTFIDLGSETNGPGLFGFAQTFLYQAWKEERALFLSSVLLLSLLPLIPIAAKSTTSAFIIIDAKGFEYNLPLFARDPLNVLSARRNTVSWDEVLRMKISEGKRTQVNAIQGPPSSRLHSAKVEIETVDFKLVLRPYMWLNEAGEDHRLTRAQADQFSEEEVKSALMECPLLKAFGLHIKYHPTVIDF